jgi:hypothetical protein
LSIRGGTNPVIAPCRKSHGAINAYSKVGDSLDLNERAGGDAATCTVEPGLSGICPDTKTRSPTRMAWEYGAPAKGAGACSLRTAAFVGMARIPSPRA